MQNFFRFTLVHPSLTDLVSETCPIGWEGQVFGMERNQDLHGIFSEYDSSLKYVHAMQAFINTVYEAEGVDGEIILKIEMIDGDGVWHQMYVGVLDLLTKKDVNLIADATALIPYQSKFLYSEINLKPKSLASLLFNRNNIPLSMRAVKNIDGGALGDYGQFDDFDLALHSKVIILESGVELAEEVEAKQFDFWIMDYKPNLFTFFDKAADELKIGQGSVDLDIVNAPETYMDLSPAFITPKEAPIYNLHIQIEGRIHVGYTQSTPLRDYRIKLDIRSEFLSFHQTFLVADLLFNGGNYETFVAIDLVYPNIAFQAEEKVWVYWELEQIVSPFTAHPVVYFDFSKSSVVLEEYSTKPDSQGKAWLVYECLAKSLEIMTGEFDVLKSSFYGRLNSVPSAYQSNGNGSLLSLTNGHQIRGNVEGKPLTFKFKELLTSLDSIDCIGMGIELNNEIEKVVIEDRKYFYQDEVLVRYDNVPKINFKRAKNLYFNQIIIGFEKWENESFNSLDEFNTKVIRNNDFKAVQNKYQRLAKFLGSGYALEIVRREQFKENPTKGNKYDNSNFFIVIRDVNGEYKPEKDEDFGVIENLISPESSYNLRISPTRSFIKHSQWFNGSMLKKQLASFDFAEGFGNYKLMTNLAIGNANEQLTRNIEEGADFIANTLEAPIFTPDEASFSVPFDMELWLELQEGTNKYKLIEFSDRDVNHYSGWIQSIKFNVSKMLFDYKILPKAGNFPIDPPLPFDIDVNFVFIFDTSSFDSVQRQQAKDYTRRFIAEFRIKYPAWQGQVFEYDVGNENWLQWATTYGKNQNLKKVVIFSFIDESHPRYHGNSAVLTTQPTAIFKGDYDHFVITHPWYDFFKMVVYAVPAGNATNYYLNHQLQVYCAVEGIIVPISDFKPSGQGDISLITQENKHSTLGLPLNYYGVSEFHNFATSFTDLPYELFKQHINEAIFG